MSLWQSPHALVDTHFDRRNGALEDQRMWRHLPGCQRCRARYRTRALLESLEPDAEARARDRIALAVFAARRPPRAIWGVALAAAAALVVLVTLPRDRFTARGGGSSAVTEEPLLSIFRLSPSGTLERVGGVIRTGDSLAFSYLNPPRTDAPYLMVFALDPSGHVYWFWPAWTTPTDDPAAVAIRTSTAPVELAEAVHHPFPPGPLTLHALFTRIPYHVSEIERAAAAQALDRLEGTLLRQPLQVLP